MYGGHGQRLQAWNFFTRFPPPPHLTLLWKYTKHGENKNKVHMQSPQGHRNSTPSFRPQLFYQRFQGPLVSQEVHSSPRLTINMDFVWEWVLTSISRPTWISIFNQWISCIYNGFRGFRYLSGQFLVSCLLQHSLPDHVSHLSHFIIINNEFTESVNESFTFLLVFDGN